MNKWIENNPILKKIYSFFKKSSQLEEEVNLFEASKEEIPSRRYPIAIYESELQMIGLDSASWDTETGGDLFGVWQDIPIIYFASLAGPKAVRNHAHFRLDVDYLIALSAQLELDWGLRYFGDWHSHHNLGLNSPSPGDQKRIVGVAEKNNFDAMAEFIITFASASGNKRQIAIYPFAYLNSSSTNLTDAGLIVLKGCSPLRSALMAASVLPEQKLSTYANFSTCRLSFPIETLDDNQPDKTIYNKHISERLISNLVSELESLTSGQVELHEQPFGYIIVIPVNNFENIAFALGNEWPHSVLQVNRINRKNGSTEELQIDCANLDALNISQIKKTYIDIISAKT